MIIHIFCDWDRRAGDLRRHRDAAASWPRAFRGVEYRQMPIHEASLRRNAKTVLGDAKTIPFFIDLLDAGIERSRAKDTDIILFSNDDVAFAEGAGEIIESVGHGWAWRRDFITLPRRLNHQTITQGHRHPGADAFWFRLIRWPFLRREMPDMLLAREAFDYVFRRIMSQQGGVEVSDLLAHAMHEQEWVRAWNTPSSRHNNRLAQEFAESKGVTELKYL